MPAAKMAGHCPAICLLSSFRANRVSGEARNPCSAAVVMDSGFVRLRLTALADAPE